MYQGEIVIWVQFQDRRQGEGTDPESREKRVSLILHHHIQEVGESPSEVRMSTDSCKGQILSVILLLREEPRYHHADPNKV